ncbi:MAG: GNAT family protein [Paraglaciecola sp.]|uniref:GNAT family N-acetyltransferase n=1 Tax=Paraglaciecola sp. TaxID=1920173 RepID=UPI003297BC9C
MIKFEVSQDISLTMLQESDADKLFKLVDSNRSHLREWLPWLDFNQSEKDSLDYIKSNLKQYSDNLGFNCGIFFSGELVGMCGYHPIDRLNKKVVIGYWIAQQAQGKGIVTKCVEFLINYAFDTLKLNKVSIPAAEYNFRSQAVSKRLGLVCEGVEREAEFLYNRFVNHIHYSVLSSEW